ncbi:protein of unknown function [Collimonas sp. OK607]|uniref:tyrosine-type recombinase/integrase n=1 Tax=Collimonas sp. OK607 TaxID=1798194 RepID=UPI0008E5546A|nr:site-specific integrase [Collimonas sp. OK607]SFB27981.1 protein of unknown function [Collimonas sp. OK607]
MAKITQKLLESIRANRSGETIRDEGNLFGRVRVKADGTVVVSFYYRFRFDEKLKDFSCGTWPGDSLSTIRANRDSARTRVGEGIDPGAQKKVTKQTVQESIVAKLAEIELQRTQNLTVQNLFDAWLTDGVRRMDGNLELQRSFKADVLPKIGNKPMKDLSEHDLRSVLRALVDRGVNRAAVVMRNNLTQMFSWAEKRQPWRKLLVNGDPMDLIEIEKIVSPDYDMNNQRDRIMSAAEIQELQDVFNRMQSEYDTAPNKRSTTQPIDQVVQCATWIMLSTMCRVGEMSMARWEHVNFDSGAWFIPKENVKGKLEDLDVFLSSFALHQFRQLHVVTGHSEWCFPARNKEGHVCVKSISKQVGDRQVMFKKGRDGKPRRPMKNRRHDNTFVLGGGKNGAWTPHDLRRTGATLMQSLGVSLEIIDRCQNHVLPGSKIRRHYLHHDYADEKREAWRLLGERLSLILNPTVGADDFLSQAADSNCPI